MVRREGEEVVRKKIVGEGGKGRREEKKLYDEGGGWGREGRRGGSASRPPGNRVQHCRLSGPAVLQHCTAITAVQYSTALY